MSFDSLRIALDKLTNETLKEADNEYKDIQKTNNYTLIFSAILIVLILLISTLLGYGLRSSIVNALKMRKSVIIPDYGVITCGTVTPEQAFIVFSSVCFACFVNFFSKFLKDARNKKQHSYQTQVMKHEKIYHR